MDLIYILKVEYDILGVGCERTKTKGWCHGSWIEQWRECGIIYRNEYWVRNGISLRKINICKHYLGEELSIEFFPFQVSVTSTIKWLLPLPYNSTFTYLIRFLTCEILKLYCKYWVHVLFWKESIITIFKF